MYPMRRMLAGAGLAAALLLTPLWAQSAQAITKVSNVRISTTEAGGDAVESGNVPTDATSAWALFDYTDANKTRIKVDVFDNSGEPLLDLEAERYSGAGTARVELRATDLVHGAAGLVELYCDDILELAEMGADTRRVDGEIVNARTSLERDLRSLGRVLVPMDRAGLTGAALGAKQTIDRLYPKVQEAVSDILGIAVTDVTATRARLEQLAPVAIELATAAGELDEEVGKLTSFTMAALYAESAPYTVSVTVDELGMASTAAGSADLVVIQASNKSPNNAAAEVTAAPSATPRLPATFTGGGGGSGAGTRQNTPVPATAVSADTTQAGRSTAAVEVGKPVVATQSAQMAALVESKAATSVALGLPTPQDGAGAAVPPGASDPQNAGGAQPLAGGSAAGNEASGSVPLPTFTVPAGNATSSGSTPAGGGGPNLIVLGAGIAVLVGLALWFRRRL